MTTKITLVDFLCGSLIIVSLGALVYTALDPAVTMPMIASCAVTVYYLVLVLPGRIYPATIRRSGQLLSPLHLLSTAACSALTLFEMFVIVVTIESFYSLTAATAEAGRVVLSAVVAAVTGWLSGWLSGPAVQPLVSAARTGAVKILAESGEMRSVIGVAAAGCFVAVAICGLAAGLNAAGDWMARRLMGDDDADVATTATRRVEDARWLQGSGRRAQWREDTLAERAWYRRWTRDYFNVSN